MLTVAYLAMVVECSLDETLGISWLLFQSSSLFPFWIILVFFTLQSGIKSSECFCHVTQSKLVHTHTHTPLSICPHTLRLRFIPQLSHLCVRRRPD